MMMMMQILLLRMPLHQLLLRIHSRSEEDKDREEESEESSIDGTGSVQHLLQSTRLSLTLNCSQRLCVMSRQGSDPLYSNGLLIVSPPMNSCDVYIQPPTEYSLVTQEVDVGQRRILHITQRYRDTEGKS